MEEILIVLGALVGIGALIIYDSFSWGFVIYKFWGWFLIPVFPQLIQIPFMQAVGMSFFFAAMRGIRSTPKYTLKGVELKNKTNWTTEIIAPWILLLLALFVKIFI